jgi:hypothetical protein
MFLRRFVFSAVLMLCAAPAFAISTALTYQGSLEDGGAPANGTYDFQFRVVTSAGAGVSGFVSPNDVAVVGGVFTVPLDFGPGIFGGNDRFLEIGVRPGTSTGAYTMLTPNTPLTATPYAQRSILAEDALSAFSADDVVDNAIDSVDIAPSAVTNSDIADSAITDDKIASGTLTMSRFAGGYGNYSLTATIGANSCSDFNVTFGGDIDTDDFPILAMRSSGSLPNNMSITALRVSSPNVVELRICNAGNATAGFTDLAVKLLTVR